MKMILCVPCAEEIKAAGGSVKVMIGKSIKVTCEGCGRRRFGVCCDVQQEKKKG